jgi:hypothetical protein
MLHRRDEIRGGERERRERRGEEVGRENVLTIYLIEQRLFLFWMEKD